MFPYRDKSRLASRTLAGLLADLRSVVRSLLLIEDGVGLDHAAADWEVGRHERASAELQPSPSVRRGASSVGKHPRSRRRRPGEPPRAPQTCLCPILREQAPERCWTRPHATQRSRGGSLAPRPRCVPGRKPNT